LRVDARHFRMRYFAQQLAPAMGPPEALNQLKGQFQAHFKKVHLREDASQAAARIVREAAKINSMAREVRFVVL
jgi:hypothetical protein